MAELRGVDAVRLFYGDLLRVMDFYQKLWTFTGINGFLRGVMDFYRDLWTFVGSNKIFLYRFIWTINCTCNYDNVNYKRRWYGVKIRLGVVGPLDSIEIVLEAINGFDEIMVLPFPYEEMEEVLEIVPENKMFVDQWFFSGQAPYSLAVANKLIREDEGSFAPLNSNSVYETLLKAQLSKNKIFKSISLDTIQESELAGTSSLAPMELHTLPYSGYMPIPEIINFHKELYEQGKVDVTITCVKTVYNTLTKLGIPCYRVTPDVIAIRLIIQYLKQRGVTQWYRKAQIAIIGIEIAQSELDGQYSYKIKFQELELKKLLLQYAESVNGSFVEIGDGRYFIYTTRGEVEMQLSKDTLFKLIEKTKIQSKFKIRIGLGYGVTSLDAEQNARLATQYARVKKNWCIIIVDEKKKIIEIEEQESPISFAHRSSFEEWDQKLVGANISSSTVSRIQSLALHYKQNEITSKELSSWMNSTERNARRILMELEKVGMVHIIGEEQSGHRGRPRKVYRLHFIDNE